MPAVAEAKLPSIGNFPQSKNFFDPGTFSHSRNFSYSPLSSDEAQLPSLSPARPMTPTMIKASETEAAAVRTTMKKGGNKKNKDKSNKALKFLESRGRILESHPS